MGGDSLLVSQLLEELKRIRLDTNVQEIFDASTLAMLASTLTRCEAVTIPPNPVSFMGLIDTYPFLVYPLTETETFLMHFRDKFPAVEIFNDSI